MTHKNTPIVELFQTYNGSSHVADMHVALVEKSVSLRDSVLAENWSKVRTNAACCLGLASGARYLLESEADAIHAKNHAAAQALADLDEALREIALSGNDETVNATFTPIIESLSPFPGALAEFEAALEKLRNGDSTTISLLDAIRTSGALSTEPPQLTIVREMTLACASRGLLGLVHADFNLTLATAQSSIGQFNGYDPEPDLRSIHDDYSSGLDARKQALHVAMSTHNSHDATYDAASQMLFFIEKRLPLFARSQAWMYLFAETLRSNGKGGASEQLGSMAARSGQLTRESIAIHVSCSRIVLELSSVKPTEEVEELLTSAPSLPIGGSLPNGTDVELANLSPGDDGRFIEISGFVTDHEIIRTADQKLLSRIGILDPSSGISARAVAIFTHLAHTGVTVGAYCRISGIYRTSSALLDGASGVEIDRLSLAEIARSNWQVALLRLSERWFQAWRNGTNMLWGLGPQFVKGKNDEVDEETSRFGAGEMIFPPFVRS